MRPPSVLFLQCMLAACGSVLHAQLSPEVWGSYGPPGPTGSVLVHPFRLGRVRRHRGFSPDASHRTPSVIMMLAWHLLVTAILSATPGPQEHRRTGSATVVSVSPTPYGPLQADTSSIVVTLRVDLAPATVSTSSVVVTSLTSGRELPVTVSLDVPSRTIRITPVEPYRRSERIRVSLTSGIQSEVNEPPFLPYQWDYRVLPQTAAGRFRLRQRVSVGRYPTAITTADLDDDGDIDIVLTTNDPPSMVLYRNTAPWTFVAVDTINLISPATSISAADYDRDGMVDIAVTSQSYGVLFFRNQGDFVLAPVFVAVPPPVDVMMQGDLDGDGDVDVVCASTDASGRYVFLRNSGGLSFTMSSDSLLPFIGGLSAGDLDNDGDLDIMAAYADSGLLRNDGDLVFTPKGIAPNAMPGPTADLDGDGDLDIVSPHNGSVYPNEGGLVFTGPTAPLVSSATLMVSDADGDGIEDLLALSADSISWFRNDGSAQFTRTTAVEFDGPGGIMAVADVDNDGDEDIAVVNYAVPFLQVLENRGMTGTFDVRPNRVFFADVPYDSLSSVTVWIRNPGVAPLIVDSAVVRDEAFQVTPSAFVVPPSDSHAVELTFHPSAWREYRDTVRFHSSDDGRPVTGLPVSGTVVQRVVESVDRTAYSSWDPAESVVVTFAQAVDEASISASTLTVEGSVTGRHHASYEHHPVSRSVAVRPEGTFLAGEQIRFTVTGGVTFADGTPVVAPYTHALTVRPRMGSGIFFPVLQVHTGIVQPYDICAFDADTNDTMEIAVLGEQYVTVVRYLGGTDFDRTDSIPIPRFSVGIAAGDMDGDGLPDIVVASGQALTVLLNQGGFAFSTVTIPLDGYPMGVAVGDLDGDARPDIVTTVFGLTEYAQVYFNDGALEFQAVGIPDASGLTRSIELADADNDGDTDIILGNSQGPALAVLENRGGRSFRREVISESAYSMTSFTTGDTDGDGWPDLIVGNYGRDRLSVFLNQHELSFLEVSEPKVFNYPLGIAAGDVDADGDPDLVVASAGFGPRVTVFSNEAGSFSEGDAFPAWLSASRLIAGDINGDGAVDVAGVDMGVQAVLIAFNRRRLPLTISVDTADFGDVPIGTTRKRRLSLMNKDTVTVVVDSIVTGSETYMVGSYPPMIQPGDSVGVDLGFTPSTVGAVVVQLTVYINGNDSLRKELRGYGYLLDAVARVGEGVPKEYALVQNYPNPFNPSTVVQFALPVRSMVRIGVYDVTGRQVAAERTVEHAAGWYEFGFDGGHLGSGIYFYRLTATPVDDPGRGQFMMTRKMLLLK